MPLSLPSSQHATYYGKHVRAATAPSVLPAGAARTVLPATTAHLSAAATSTQRGVRAAGPAAYREQPGLCHGLLGFDVCVLDDEFASKRFHVLTVWLDLVQPKPVKAVGSLFEYLSVSQHTPATAATAVDAYHQAPEVSYLFPAAGYLLVGNHYTFCIRKNCRGREFGFASSRSIRLENSGFFFFLLGVPLLLSPQRCIICIRTLFIDNVYQCYDQTIRVDVLPTLPSLQTYNLH